MNAKNLLFSFLLCTTLLTSNILFADVLTSARDAEIQRMVICPEKPLIAVFGKGANLWIDKLLHTPEFRSHFLVTERTFEMDAHGAQCSISPTAENTASLSPEHFAMVLVNVELDSNENSENLIHIKAIRTDTGKEIFEKNEIIKSSNSNNFQKIVSDFLNALNANQYTCRNKFKVTVTEDVKLRCQGVAPGLRSQYKVSSDFRMIFKIKNMDFDGQSSDQNLSGSVELLPAKSQTDLYLAVTNTNDNCKHTMMSHRKIMIDLDARISPAVFHLVIPKNIYGSWNFVPRLTSAEPLFQGNAVIKNFLKSVSEGACENPPTEQTITEYYNHKEHNVFKFAIQELRPLCQAVNYVQPVFTKAPSLGTVDTSDITSGCTTSSANVRVDLKRRFFEMRSSS